MSVQCRCKCNALCSCIHTLGVDAKKRNIAYQMEDRAADGAKQGRVGHVQGLAQSEEMRVRAGYSWRDPKIYPTGYTSVG
jgi:hypothetical protein